MQGSGSVEPVQVLKGLVAARLRVEHAYYKLVGHLDAFCIFWTQGVLCTIQNEDE